MAVFIEIQLNGVFFKHCKECVLCENRLNYILAMALKLRIHYMNSIEQKKLVHSNPDRCERADKS